MLSRLSKIIKNNSQPTNSSIDTVSAHKKETQTRRKVTWKRVLYHPLTGLAVGLHAALLFIPFNPSSPAVVEAEEENENEEAISVDLLDLSAIAPPDPTPALSNAAPSDTPPPLPDSVPPAPQSAPQSAPQPALQPAPVTTPPAPAQAPAEPSPDPSPAAPSPAQPTSPNPTPPTPNPTSTPVQSAYDPSQDQQDFVSNLGFIGLSPYADSLGLPAPSDFREPSNVGFFLNGEQPVPNARSAKWLDKEPNDVSEQLQANYAKLTFTQLQDYGGETLYHITTPQGETVMYLSLAQLKGSTLLVLWPESPI